MQSQPESVASDDRTLADEAWNIVYKNHVPYDVAVTWIKRGTPLLRVDGEKKPTQGTLF